MSDVLCSPGSFSSSLVQKQIHKILAEVLGGADRARASVLTPYFYTIGECPTLKLYTTQLYLWGGGSNPKPQGACAESVSHTDPSCAVLLLDFECVLDRYNRPVAYSEPNTLQISDGGKVQWRAEPTETVMNELPPG